MGVRPLGMHCRSGRSLERVQPREQSTLPVKIAELTPGAAHKVELHYDGLKWIEDDLDVNRIDPSWAVKLLDFSSSWVTSVNPKSLPSALSATGRTHQRLRRNGMQRKAVKDEHGLLGLTCRIGFTSAEGGM